MRKFKFRTANINDIDFLIKSIFEAEKSGSEILSYAKIFNLSELELASIFRSMFLEELDGCEFSVSNYIVAEYENKVVASIGAWVEDKQQSSSKIKSNLLAYHLPRESILYASQVSKITSELVIQHVPGLLSLVVVYVDPEQRGNHLLDLLTLEHLKRFSGITDLSLQVMANNVFAIRAYEKIGYQITFRVKSDNESILNFLPGNEKLLMKKKIKLTIMEENQIIEKLEKIFSSVFGKESVTLTRATSAGDIAEWNSLNHMIMIAEVETTFNIKFKLKELNKMQQVGDLIDLIISKSAS